jgi:hypothetical protein
MCQEVFIFFYYQVVVGTLWSFYINTTRMCGERDEIEKKRDETRKIERKNGCHHFSHFGNFNDKFDSINATYKQRTRVSFL